MVDSPLIGPFQIDIVDADHFSAVDVDNLAVDEVPLQKEIAAFVLEGSERLSRAQFERAGRSFHNFLRRHNRKARAGLESNPCHPAAVRSRGNDNILELAPQLTVRVCHRRAEKRRQADADWGALVHARLRGLKVDLWTEVYSHGRGACRRESAPGPTKVIPCPLDTIASRLETAS